MSDLTAVCSQFHGDVVTEESPGYDEARRPRDPGFQDLDIGLMGGGVVTAALEAGLVDDLVLHQVPVLLGGGHQFFQSLPAHVRLRLLEAVAAPGVTHPHYEVVR